MFRRVAIAVVLLALLSPIGHANAQIPVSQLDTPVVEDFTGYNGSGFGTMGQAGRLDSDNWTVRGVSDGDLAFGTNTNMGDYARGSSTGGVTEGGVYAFDIGMGDAALGAQGTDVDFAPGELVWRFTNGVNGEPVAAVELTWTVWSFNDSDGVSMVTAQVFDGTRTVTLGTVVSTADIADAMPGWTATTQTAQTTNLYIPSGAEFEIRFVIDEPAGTGVRDEVAVDDLSLVVRANAAACATDPDCDDGSPCNGSEVCTNSFCEPGTFEPQSTPCGDTNITECDGADVCDGNGVCDPNHAPPGAPCLDGTFCNGDETCDGAGACLPGTPPVVDDGVACTVDSCDEAAMMVLHMPDDSACDDTVECTFDTCDPMAGCQNVQGCDIDGMCVPAGATRDDNLCLICDPQNTTTMWTPLPENTECSPASCDGGDAHAPGFCNADPQCVIPEPEMCPNGCEIAILLESLASDDACEDG